MSDQSNLNLETKKSGPVECLGQTFPSDEARREHYLKLLAEKLKDPEFRKIEGFPIGEDEDILALSDPPYYTACPNPWIGEFIEHYGRPYDPTEKYHREPFAADVSEGKNDPIYNAHPYHTKVPPRAIAKYIEHYSNPGDTVLDMFAGTGMTGVASSLLTKSSSRYTILADLSPIATWIAHGLNHLLDPERLLAAREQIEEIASTVDQNYQVNYHGEDRRILYQVWSDILSCPECAGDFCFWDVAVDRDSGSISDSFDCPHCNSNISKRRCTVVTTAEMDIAVGKVVAHGKREPIVTIFQKGKRNDRHLIDGSDRDNFVDSPPQEDESVPRERIDRDLDIWWDRDYRQYGVYSIDRFFTNRALENLLDVRRALFKLEDYEARHIGLLAFTAILRDCSLMTGLDIKKFFHGGGGPFSGGVKGTFFIPSLAVEKNVSFALENRLSSLARACKGRRLDAREKCIISTQSSTSLEAVPDNSVDYVFVDPPFGSNFIYSELNLIHEARLGVKTADDEEAVVHRRRKENPSLLSNYQELMRASFCEAYRVLKPGRWITVEFSNTSASVWNSLQAVIQEAGFVVANVAALDKKQGSFKAVTTTTAVKQDLVISAYKPNGGLEARFQKSAHSVEGVWDFIKTHLRNLPVVKPRGGDMDFITERDPRILHDRMVAFHIGHGVPVPLSSAEFQKELAEKFPEREGMFFLPDQVTVWDKKRAQMQGVGQMSIFVEDEKSAIDWLRDFLKRRPSTYQDIQPEFMQTLGASWKKFETRPELQLLLTQNFLKDEGQGEVPSQIHSYLSTQNKDLRNLPKDDARLKNRAKDRWYVPDPAKAVDVESMRNKRLLQEFWELCDEAGINRPTTADPSQRTLPLATPLTKKVGRKKLKEVRTEAVRQGFKECFAAKDYPTILGLAAHLPTNVIEEDEQLQMIHDMAEMRSEG